MTIILDLETDGLWPNVTKIHCAVAYDTKLDKIVCKWGPEDYDYPEVCIGNDCLCSIKYLPEWLHKHAHELSCHNGFSFDLKVLKKVLGYEYKGLYRDTLLMSRIIWPDVEGGHSVDAWAQRFGMYKPVHEDWTQFSEEMLHRCCEDVKIQAQLWDHIQEHIKTIQKNDPRVNFETVFKMEHKVAEIMAKQYDYGWQVDLEQAFKTKDIIEREHNELEQQLMESLPIRVINVLDGKETKAFTNSGEITAIAGKWIENSNFFHKIGVKTNISTALAGDFCKVLFERMNPGSPDQIKEYLLVQGWKPLNWNYKKDRFKKDVKDKYGNKIKTAPKMPKGEEWEIVEQLTDNPKIKLIAKLYVLRHRKGLVNSFIDNTDCRTHRIHYDVISCGAATTRMLHKIVVNVPRVE